MKRVVIPELLDSDAGTPREISDSLADLRMINRFFGGARTMTGLLGEIADRRQLKSISWLDVAGASGDIAALATEALAEKGIALKPVLLDRSAAHLNGKFPSVCGDALALPFRDNSFDVVVSSLAIHNIRGRAGREKAVSEAVRVLRPGGRLLIADVRGTRPHQAQLAKIGMNEVTGRRLRWPFMARLVTATKPGGRS